MIVSRHTLGALVRSTAISAYLHLISARDIRISPYALRREQIFRLSTKYRPAKSLSSYYVDLMAAS